MIKNDVMTGKSQDPSTAITKVAQAINPGKISKTR